MWFDWQNEWGWVAFLLLGQCYHTYRVKCDNTILSANSEWGGAVKIFELQAVAEAMFRKNGDPSTAIPETPESVWRRMRYADQDDHGTAD